MKIYKNNQLLTDNCKVAGSFFSKLFGKLFVKEPLLLMHCRSVHTCFLRNRLDIIILNNENKVIKIFNNFPPNNIILPVKNSFFVLEFNAGFVKSAKIKISDILVFEE